MANNRIAYGIAKGMGINTDGMSPYQVWQLINERTLNNPDGNVGIVDLLGKSINKIEETNDNDSKFGKRLTQEEYEQKLREQAEEQKRIRKLLSPAERRLFDKGKPVYCEAATKRCEELKKLLIEKYGIENIRELKWSGRVYIAYHDCLREGASGQKVGNCDIYICSDKINDDVLIHELLHSASVSHCLRAYESNKNIEEGIVEMLTQEICKKENMKLTKNGYGTLVGYLYEIQRQMPQLAKNPYQFARKYFKIDLSERADYLSYEIHSLSAHLLEKYKIENKKYNYIIGTFEKFCTYKIE